MMTIQSMMPGISSGWPMIFIVPRVAKSAKTIGARTASVNFQSRKYKKVTRIRPMLMMMAISRIRFFRKSPSRLLNKSASNILARPLRESRPITGGKIFLTISLYLNRL